MATEDDALREVKQAAQRRAMVEREAERARNAAAADLVAAVRRAQGEGVALARIAREIGLSRQRLYELLKRG